jgi:hypothetical protein
MTVERGTEGLVRKKLSNRTARQIDSHRTRLTVISCQR